MWRENERNALQDKTRKWSTWAARDVCKILLDLKKTTCKVKDAFDLYVWSMSHQIALNSQVNFQVKKIHNRGVFCIHMLNHVHDQRKKSTFSIAAMKHCKVINSAFNRFGDLFTPNDSCNSTLANS